MGEISNHPEEALQPWPICMVDEQLIPGEAEVASSNIYHRNLTNMG